MLLARGTRTASYCSCRAFTKKHEQCLSGCPSILDIHGIQLMATHWLSAKRLAWPAGPPKFRRIVSSVSDLRTLTKLAAPEAFSHSLNLVTPSVACFARRQSCFRMAQASESCMSAGSQAARFLLTSPGTVVGHSDFATYIQLEHSEMFVPTENNRNSSVFINVVFVKSSIADHSSRVHNPGRSALAPLG